MNATNDHRIGGITKLWMLAVSAAAMIGTAAHAVTLADVQASCSTCHGLTVNGVVVSAGLGSNGFIANVSGRSQGTWVSTITRMTGYGAVVGDINGTAAYLVGLGTTVGTATPTPPFGATATPTPTPTPTPKNNRLRGAAAYQAYCASCHEPSSTTFVGATAYGSSRRDIIEALSEVQRMQFLSPLLTRRTIGDIARYLRTSNRGGGGGDND